jgi:hypothetical protein
MKIGYRPGKSHQNADCLSRIPKNLGAIPKTPIGVGVIAAVTFTQRKDSQQTTGSVHVVYLRPKSVNGLNYKELMNIFKS